MSHLFRLCYCLRRTGEKLPLLLLEPVLISPQVHSLSPPSATTLGGTVWYLYAANGTCEAIELRKLQAVNKPQNLWRDLRLQSDKPSAELGEELRHLWQASVKGIAQSRLERGQLIASEGIWLVAERSFYALVFGSRQLKAQQPHTHIELTEESTGRRLAATLSVQEQFTSPNGPISLCLLSLERRSLLSMKQALAPENYLYQNSARPIFLFAPSRWAPNISALRNFLGSRLPKLAGQTCHDLEDLAADFIGWGEYRHPTNSAKDDWVALGGWRLRRQLLQKYGTFIQQRARQFGGYPIANLLAEPFLPLALLRSLVAYLGTATTETATETLQGSCCKIDGHLLIKEAVYTPDGAGEFTHVSPQGHKLLQDLISAGKEGLSLFHLQRHQEQVLQALLRSGWAVKEGQRCYASSCRKEKILPPKSFASAAAGGRDTPEESLSQLLASYKKKNKLRDKRNLGRFAHRPNWGNNPARMSPNGNPKRTHNGTNDEKTRPNKNESNDRPAAPSKDSGRREKRFEGKNKFTFEPRTNRKFGPTANKWGKYRTENTSGEAGPPRQKNSYQTTKRPKKKNARRPSGNNNFTISKVQKS